MLSKPEVHELLARAERNAILSLAIHGLLQDKGEAHLAQAVWVFHLQAVKSATFLGKTLGVEVTCD